MKNEKIIIELAEYSISCFDDCYTDYGTITKVNGKELFCTNQDTETIIKQLLNHLGYEVDIFRTYNGLKQ